jgi:frataxin
MITDGEIFETIAEKTLNILLDRIDEVLGDTFDVDLNGGILNIELENGTQYVINKNAPNYEIWMSSPLSGASHYYLDEDLETWVDTRSGDKFFKKLSEELSQCAGKSFTF